MKITRFRYGNYRTGYHSTPYTCPGTRVFYTEEKAFFEGALVTEYSPGFRVISSIHIFFPVPPLFFNRLNVISSFKRPVAYECTNQIVYRT